MLTVQATAHEALSRKLHAVRKHYYADPFVGFFETDHTLVNSPLMNRGFWVRVRAVENVIRVFSQLHGGAPIQVVSLGSGMDTLFFRWAATGKLGTTPETAVPVSVARFLEVDLPDICHDKELVVQRTPELQELIAKHPGVYHAVPGDMAHVGRTVELLRSALDTSEAAPPTLFLAECVFTYFPAAASTELMAACAGLFQNVKGGPDVMFFTYDAMQPSDRFGKMMLENLHQRGLELPGVTDLPTLDAHTKRAQGIGFPTVAAWDMKALHMQVPPAVRAHLDKLEMIDDWDEWNLVMTHYCVVVAWTVPDKALPLLF